MKLNLITKGLIFSLIILTVCSCKSLLYVQEEKVTYNDIDIPLYETSINDTERQFGLKYEKLNWNEFSTEYLYKSKGISFSHKQKDSLKMIYWINAETSRNIINIENRIKINNQTTVSNVIEELGNNTWDYDSTYTDLIIEYEYFDIIIELKEGDIQILNNEFISADWEDGQKVYKTFKNHHIKGIEVY